MSNHRNHTFFVDDGHITADANEVEKVITLRLPVTMFISFAHGTGHGAYGIGVTRVVISEHRYKDEDDYSFQVELKGFALTKAGRIDKRSGSGSDYHYAWCDTKEEVDRLMAALPDNMNIVLLDGTIMGFTKQHVGDYLYSRVARIAEQFSR